MYYQPTKQSSYCKLRFIEVSLCIVLDHMSYIYTLKKPFSIMFEVTNMSGPIIFGRMQAKAVGYVNFH